VDGGHPSIDTFLIRPNAYPAKILEKGCPTWPDNRGCTVYRHNSWHAAWPTVVLRFMGTRWNTLAWSPRKLN